MHPSSMEHSALLALINNIMTQIIRYASHATEVKFLMLVVNAHALKAGMIQEVDASSATILDISTSLVNSVYIVPRTKCTVLNYKNAKIVLHQLQSSMEIPVWPALLISITILNISPALTALVANL